MSTSEIQIERAGEADLPEVLALNILVQPHLKRSLELLRWQYFESPPHDSRIYLAREPRTGTLISSYGAVAQWLQVGSRKIEAWMIQDVMTHPEHRGRGLLHALAAACFEEMKRVGIAGYTFPNERSQMSFMRTGWERVGLIPSREVALGARTGTTALQPIPAADLDAVTRIWNESGLGLGVARDAAFVQWRYRKPGARYMLCSDRRDYFAALKLFDGENGRVLHVLDLFTTAGTRSRLPELVTACLDFGVEHGATRATAWLPANHAYAPAFDAAGFALKERAERFFYADIPADVGKPSPYWHLTQGDSDVY